MALPPPPTDQAQTRLGVAALFVALVRTLGAEESSVLPRAEAELERLYQAIRDYPEDWDGTLAMLKWTGERLREPK